MGASVRPETFLARLEPGREVPAGSVRGLAGAAAALEAAGWIQIRRDGRKTLIALTDAGVAQRAALPAKPERPAKPAKVPGAAKVTLASLAARVEALEAQVASLRAPPTPAAAPPTAHDPAALAAAILDATAALDARERLGGLVPIPALRRDLRARGVTADDGAVTDALLDLERSFGIDLSVAQSPTAVAERGAGIERPGRGLLYYVTRR